MTFLSNASASRALDVVAASNVHCLPSKVLGLYAIVDRVVQIDLLGRWPLPGIRGARRAIDSKECNGHRRLIGRSMCFTTREAESDNGMGRPDIIDERWCAESNELESNAKGVLLLLLSARASLLRHGANEACLKTMEDCIASFRMQHNLTGEDANEGILWEETSVGALLRLLEYVHGEVSESLQDGRCAEQLELCIEHVKEECVL